MAAAALAHVRVLGLSGSLRKLSANSALLRYARVSPALGKHAELIIADLSTLPMYDGDVEAAGVPSSVVALRELADSCDTMLIASPEYNYSIAPVTSNAISWLSRFGPNNRSPLTGKTCALISASGGNGGFRSQTALRDSLFGLDLHVLNKPEVAVPVYDGQVRFDHRTGDLIDAATQRKVDGLVAALLAWHARLGPSPGPGPSK